MNLEQEKCQVTIFVVSEDNLLKIVESVHSAETFDQEDLVSKFKKLSFYRVVNKQFCWVIQKKLDSMLAVGLWFDFSECCPQFKRNSGTQLFRKKGVLSKARSVVVSDCDVLKDLPQSVIDLMCRLENRMTIEEATQFAQSLSRFVALETLILAYCQIQPAQAQVIAQALEQSTCLKSLDLKTNSFSFSSESHQALLSALCKLTQLTELNLLGNIRFKKQMGGVAKAVGSMTNLTVLSLSCFEPLSEKQSQVLSKNLRKLTQLTKLHCVGNSSRSENVVPIVEALQVLTQLTVCKLCCFSMRLLPVAQNFAKTLQSLTQLTQLKIEDNKLGKGMGAVARSFPGSLKKLNLQSNNLNADEGSVQALVGVLSSLTQLGHLNLSDNDLSHDATQSVLQELAKMTYLVSLKMSGSEFSTPGAEGSLRKVLFCVVGLTQLDLSRTQWDDSKELTQSLELGKSLKDLNLSHIKFVTDEEVKDLSYSLCRLTGLESLNLSYSDVDPEYSLELMDTFQKLTRLKKLKLHQMKFEGRSSQDVQQTLQTVLLGLTKFCMGDMTDSEDSASEDIDSD